MTTVMSTPCVGQSFSTSGMKTADLGFSTPSFCCQTNNYITSKMATTLQSLPLVSPVNSEQKELVPKLSPPKHPKYQTKQQRLESFVAWPGRYVPKTPEELATAGFFYIGSADRVTCFQCGITLRDWEEEHEPVREHRRYSENCSFINKPDLEQLGVSRRTLTASTDLETDTPGALTEEQDEDGDLEVDGADVPEDIPREPPPPSPHPHSVDAAVYSDALTPAVTASLEDVCPQPLAPYPHTFDAAVVYTELASPVGAASVEDHLGSLVIEDSTPEDDLEVDSYTVEDAIEDTDHTEMSNLKAMGFSDAQIERALTQFHNRYGRKHNNTSELIEMMLGEEMVPSEVTSQVQQDNKNQVKTGRSFDHEEMKTRQTSHDKTKIENRSHEQMKIKNSSPTNGIVSPLRAENRRLREQKQCKKCRTEDVGVLFLPCGHLVTCQSCADSCVHCILCGKDILGTVKTYLI